MRDTRPRNRTTISAPSRKRPRYAAYVVFIGRLPGIYETWNECKGQTDGYHGAVFKGYPDYESAIEAWDALEQDGVLPYPSRGAVKKSPRIDPIIERRARALVASGSGSGSSLTTCTAASCAYPACMCGVPEKKSRAGE